MPRLPGFIGPSNVNRSLTADVERTINFYPEIVDGGGLGKNRALLHGTPGFRPFVSLSGSPVRALFAQDGRAWAVCGIFFFEFFANGTKILYGTVAEDGDPATISSNGTNGFQLFITSGGFGYIFNTQTNTFQQIVDPDLQTPIKAGAFLDGYFIALKDNSSQFQLSDLNDGLSWDGTQVAQRSTGSDHVTAMIVEHRNLWLLGTKTSEVWVNIGTASFPFQPIRGAFIENGCVAAFSPARLDNSVFWLGLDERGEGVVYRSQGYQPKRISSHAVETAIQQYDRVDNIVGWTYQDEGHLFYQLNAPNAETSWTYDVATDLWHERARWDIARYCWTPDIVQHHAFAFGKHLVGDRRIGVIYDMDLSYFQNLLILP